MEEVHKAILLNKAFSGDWLKQEDHIGHEIIDLILSDDGTHYVYYSPWGAVSNNVVVEGEVRKKRKKGKVYEVKYLVLTGSYDVASKSAEVLYVIELKEKLHSLSSAKNNNSKKLKNNYNYIKKLIDDKKITYNNVPLYDAYPKYDSEGHFDKTLFVTFTANKIYRTKKQLLYKFEVPAKRKNALSYTDDNNRSADYFKLKSFIDDNIKKHNLESFKPNSMEDIKKQGFKTTFFDLIDYGNVEQAYTNILYSVLMKGGLINAFCKIFKKKQEVLSTNPLHVFREKKLVQGRMDVCAVTVDQKIIIENKVNSGLNGIKEDDSSQLSTYYNWGTSNVSIPPLCFLTFPDIHSLKIKKEIQQHDPRMASHYNLVTYGQIADFIEKNKAKVPTTYEYYRYLDDIVHAFRNLSYKTKEQYYAQRFLMATTR